MPTSPQDTPHYQMFPRVAPEGWSGRLRVTGEYAHTKLVAGLKYEYALTSMRWFADTERKREPITGVVKADRSGGLSIPFAPDAPGEWLLEVTSEDKRVRVLPTLGLYVIDRALRRLRPFVGELHAHSTGSDGRQEPAYCAISARRMGYDFFALTDHNNFGSSAEMVRKVRGKLGSKMLLIRGEELHVGGCDFHYVGLGQSESIEDIRSRRKKTHGAEVREIIRELRARPTVERLDPRIYAEGLWKIRKVKELGGLVLFAHPYWSHNNALFIDEAHREQTFIDREFDAVEVTTTADASFTMSNRIAHEAAQGRPVNVVGVSDGHNWSEQGSAGRHWTYVLAEDLTQDAVFDAVRSGRSLACEDIAGRLRLAGPFELVDFADFYHRRLWPIRRRVMRLEAELAFSALRRGPRCPEMTAELDAELERIDRRLWA